MNYIEYCFRIFFTLFLSIQLEQRFVIVIVFKFWTSVGNVEQTHGSPSGTDRTKTLIELDSTKMRACGIIIGNLLSWLK